MKIAVRVGGGGQGTRRVSRRPGLLVSRRSAASLFVGGSGVGGPCRLISPPSCSSPGSCRQRIPISKGELQALPGTKAEVVSSEGRLGLPWRGAWLEGPCQALARGWPGPWVAGEVPAHCPRLSSPGEAVTVSRPLLPSRPGRAPPWGAGRLPRGWGTCRVGRRIGRGLFQY